MLLKSEIADVFHAQQNVLKKELLTKRNYLIENTFKGKQIEVISGIRRSGKSTLMRMIMSHYAPNVVSFNFEDSRVFGFDVTDFQRLDEIIGDGHPVYFFDEIQNVENWEIFVRQLHERGEKVFVTGSNASLLSKELGTKLTGRYLSHELFPFAYNEFLEHTGQENSLSVFESYRKLGGFPEFLDSQNTDVLQTLLRDILFRDIAIRHGVRNTKTLFDITLHLLSNVGKETTYNSLRKSFNIGSTNSVSDYLNWLEDTYILFLLPRFSWSPKSVLVNPRKVYAIDTGFVQANTLSRSADSGRLLENIVYLHLRQKIKELYFFREKGECDFVVMEKEQCKKVIQVCEELHSENKNREINGLLEAMHFFGMEEGYIYTLDQEDEFIVDGKKILVKKVRDILYSL
jgi:predicted AAA+ superfamily ATPase